MEYDIQINNGVEAFGTAGQKTITRNQGDRSLIPLEVNRPVPMIPSLTPERTNR